MPVLYRPRDSRIALSVGIQSTCETICPTLDLPNAIGETFQATGLILLSELFV